MTFINNLRQFFDKASEYYNNYDSVKRGMRKKRWEDIYGDNPYTLIELLRLIRYSNIQTKTLRAKCFGSVNPILFEIHPNNEISKALYVTRTYEPETILFLSKSLRKDDVFVDVGANIGVYSLFASKYVSQVYSFEPSTREYNRFISNLKLNPTIKNIEVHKLALGDSSAEVTLNVAKEYNGGHNTICSNFIWDVALGYQEKVQQVSLDMYLAKLTHNVSAIKIDVEGYEMEVLRGAQETLQAKPPRFIIFECIERSPQKTEAICQFLKKFRYKIFYISQDGFLTKERLYKSGNLVARQEQYKDLK